jgi:hypothetical protein
LPLFAIDISIIIFIIDAILIIFIIFDATPLFRYAISPRHFARFHQRYFAFVLPAPFLHIFITFSTLFDFIRIDIFIIDISLLTLAID